MKLAAKTPSLLAGWLQRRHEGSADGSTGEVTSVSESPGAITPAGTSTPNKQLPAKVAEDIDHGDLGRRLPAWIVPAFAVGVGFGTGAVLAAMWLWINGIPGLVGKDFAAAKLDATRIALSVAVGGGGLFALYLAVRRQRATEQDLRDRRAAQRHTENDATERRITELFTKAADQLGADKHTVRLAGLYALERLAQTNSEHRQTIVNLLCAYLRTPYTPPAARILVHGIPRPTLRNLRIRHAALSPAGDATLALSTRRREAILERDVRLAAQHILADHLRPDLDGAGTINPKYWPEKIDLDLTGANLIDLDFHDCVIHGADFIDAIFTGSAQFHGAIFTGRTVFADATFTRFAMFETATFTGHANFGGVTFAELATFENATFVGGVTFEVSTFMGDTCFDGATFVRSADRRTEPSVLLRGAVAQLYGQDGARDHQWPHGWKCEDVLRGPSNKQDRWARLVFASESSP